MRTRRRSARRSAVSAARAPSLVRVPIASPRASAPRKFGCAAVRLNVAMIQATDRDYASALVAHDAQIAACVGR